MNQTFSTMTLCLLLILVSCQSNPADPDEATSDTVAREDRRGKNVSGLDGCYLMIQKKDTAFLDVNINDGTVSGKLEYRRYEKDSNKGVIRGVVRDSLIIADYNFQSEGMNSVREVIFLVKGNSLYEGYGEIKVTGDSAKFVDAGQLKFMTEPFVKVECDKK